MQQIHITWERRTPILDDFPALAMPRGYRPGYIYRLKAGILEHGYEFPKLRLGEGLSDNWLYLHEGKTLHERVREVVLTRCHEVGIRNHEEAEAMTDTVMNDNKAMLTPFSQTVSEYDFTSALKWTPGEYGDEDSCYNAPIMEELEEHNVCAIRFYREGKGVARALYWYDGRQDRHVFWDAYGMTIHQIGKYLSHIIGGFTYTPAESLYFRAWTPPAGAPVGIVVSELMPSKHNEKLLNQITIP